MASVRAAAAVLWDQCRQHGFDDQPLHREPQGAEQRRLFAGRTDWTAARSRDVGLLPAGSGGLPWRARNRGRGRGVVAAARALRLLERQGPPLDPDGQQSRPRGVRHGRIVDRRDCPPLGRRSNDAGSARHAGRGVCLRRLGKTARRRAYDSQLRTGGVRQTGLRGRHEDDPQRDQPLQRPAARSVARSAGGGGQPAALPDHAGGDGSNLWVALHAKAASDLSRTDTRVGHDQGFGHDHARLFRGLHLLFDHHPPRPHHPVAQQRIGARRNPADDRRPQIQRHHQRHWRSDRQHVPDDMFAARGRGGLSTAIVRSSHHLQIVGNRSRATRRTDARGAGNSRHQKGAGRQRHPHGLSSAIPRIHAGTCAASRGRPFESRSGTHRPNSARPDAQAQRR